MAADPPALITRSHPVRGHDRRTSALRAAFRTIGRVAPGTTARLAEALFVKTARPAPREPEEAFLALAERFTVRAAGETIAGYGWGPVAGPIVMVVHGWWSHAGRFAPMATVLTQAGFRVVGFDAPGHGRSSGWRASMPEFAATLRAVAEHAGSVHAIVGHSLGGAASIFAMARGLEASRAVTIAAPADLRGWAYQFRDTFGIPPAAFERMKTNLERRLRITWQDLEVPVLARQLDIPGLVIHDVHDPDVPWTEGQTIADGWRGAEFMATEGLGHRAILRDEVVIGRVVEFLSVR